MPLTDHTQRLLFDAAAAFARVQPWQVLAESDIFAIDVSETGQRGYCVVLGNDGDFQGLSVMRGDRGLVLYEDMLFEEEDESSMLDISQQDCVMLSFYEKEEYPDNMMTLVKHIGADIAGDGFYPVFEDYSPGLYPWDVSTEADGQLLLRAIDCALSLHKQVLDRGEEVLFPPAGSPEEVVPLMKPGTHGWEIARWLDVSSTEMPPMTAEADPEAMQTALNGLAFRRNSAWAVSLMLLPEPAQEAPDQRPYFPYLLLAVELGHGTIVGSRMFSPADFANQLQPELAELIQEAGYIPERVITINEEETDLFGGLLDAAGIQTIMDPEAAHVIEGIAQALFSMGNEPMGDDEYYA